MNITQNKLLDIFREATSQVAIQCIQVQRVHAVLEIVKKTGTDTVEMEKKLEGLSNVFITNATRMCYHLILIKSLIPREQIDASTFEVLTQFEELIRKCGQSQLLVEWDDKCQDH